MGRNGEPDRWSCPQLTQTGMGVPHRRHVGEWWNRRGGARLMPLDLSRLAGAAPRAERSWVLDEAGKVQNEAKGGLLPALEITGRGGEQRQLA